MLLIGAGLLLACFQRLQAGRPGFEEGNLLTAQLSLPASRYQPRDVDPFIKRLLPQIRSIPGVVSAALASHVPFSGDSSAGVIMAEGYRLAPGESLISPYRVRVTPEYLRTLHIPLLSGRDFIDGDNAVRVAIVDERLARKFWPDQEAVGRRMFTPSNPGDPTKPAANRTWITVVGVVAESRIGDVVVVGAADRIGTYYVPLAQDPTRSLTLALRTSRDPLSVVPEIRSALSAIDPALSLESVRTQ